MVSHIPLQITKLNLSNSSSKVLDTLLMVFNSNNHKKDYSLFSTQEDSNGINFVEQFKQLRNGDINLPIDIRENDINNLLLGKDH